MCEHILFVLCASMSSFFLSILIDNRKCTHIGGNEQLCVYIYENEEKGHYRISNIVSERNNNSNNDDDDEKPSRLLHE